MSMNPFVAFNRPYVGDEEVRALSIALGTESLGGAGPISRRVEHQLCEWLGVRHAFLTPSCTHALEMAMLTLGIGPGDEVIMPSFTFVSTANAVVLRGGKPVFAEIEAETLNLDPSDVLRRITPRTRAIIPVHYAGVACRMDDIMDVARANGLHVVEDAAHAVDARYRGRPLGTIGDIGCLSFHDTKNITCGEGGAFLTDSEEIARKAAWVCEKGTNRAEFLRGEIDKYTWISDGSSYLLSDMLAAVLEVQLLKREEIRACRRLVWEAYAESLSPLAEKHPLHLPHIPADAQSNYHIFYFRTRTMEQRDRILIDLRKGGIHATFHYVPLHSSPYGRNVLGCMDDLPVTRACNETLIRLPVYPQLAPIAGEIAGRVADIVGRSESLPAQPQMSVSL